MKKLIAILMFPATVMAQSDYQPKLQQFMTGQHDYFRFNGNVMVITKGKIIYQQALGYADYDSKRALNDSSVFELASVSKQFTAMGIMICKERGLLSYFDNIKKFFPDLPYDNITVRNLLTHTSGLPSYEDQFEKNWDHKKIAFNKVSLICCRGYTIHYCSNQVWDGNTAIPVTPCSPLLLKKFQE
jgi:CubicO group peptidase (beta-lactamase class C family)